MRWNANSLRSMLQQTEPMEGNSENPNTQKRELPIQKIKWNPPRGTPVQEASPPF